MTSIMALEADPQYAKVEIEDGDVEEQPFSRTEPGSLSSRLPPWVIWSALGAFCAAMSFSFILEVASGGEISFLSTRTHPGLSDLQLDEGVNVSQFCPSNLPQTADHWLRLVESYANVSSEDLCLEGESDCRCHNPVVPIRGSHSRWNTTFDRNLELVQEEGRNLDIVLLGDSITEHWLGTDLSNTYDKWTGQNEFYMSRFYKSNGGPLDGLALGIGGDRTPNIYYRILNGEHEEVKPKIWWLLVGTNDAGGEYCSSEAIAVGNIMVAETILQQQPGARVVLNSLLPRDFGPLSKAKIWNILKEANTMLECYAATRRGVFFFNATDLFLEDSETLNATMMQDPVHPNAIGSQVWGNAIVDYALELL